MLPQYQRLEQSDNGSSSSSSHNLHHPSGKRRLHIPFERFAVVTLSLPLFAFVYCVLWSVVYNFESSTSTHCYVRNLLPSISAAIGNYQPQRFVWQSAILLTVGPRLWVTGNYVLLYGRQTRRNRRLIAYTACVFNAVENLALVGLSLFTSTDDYEMHKLCFLIFIAMSEFYMVMTYFVNRTSRKVNDPLAQRSLRYKRNLCVLNLLSFAVAGYCFTRHNERCEPYSECC